MPRSLLTPGARAAERARQAEYRASEKGKLTARKMHLRKHSLTPEKYDEMLAEQDGKCAVCKGEQSSGWSMSVDHDHGHCPGPFGCGDCVRGLLCQNCNMALGYAGDNPETLLSLYNYLKRFK